MIVRKLRLQRGWSQGQLAEMAGITTRTVQRIERGQRPSLETSKALAAVFEVDLSVIQPEEHDMNDDNAPATRSDAALKADEREAMLYVKRIKEFYEFLVIYLFMAAFFLFIFPGHRVIYIVFGVLAAGLALQGLIAYGKIGFLSPGWERRMIEKRLGRKL